VSGGAFTTTTPVPRARRYFENRKAALKTWTEAGVTPYPHKFEVPMRLPAFVEAFNALPPGTVLEDVTVSVAGRLMSSRSSSAKLQFYDLHGEGAKIQIMFNAAYIMSMWRDPFGKTLILTAFGMEVLGAVMLARLAKSV
jgi:lysyl-tRNA synthetase class II